MQRTIAKVLAGGFVGLGLFCGVAAVKAEDSAAPPTTQAADQPNDQAAQAYSPDPEAMLDRIRSRVDTLSLSDDQKQKIDDLFAKVGQSFKLADQELQNATRQQRQQHMRDLYQQLRDGIRSVLTPEQLKQFRQKMAAAPLEMLNQLRDALSNPRLQLSDDQKQKVHDLLEKARTEMEQAMSQAQASGQDASDKVRSSGGELRQKLRDILNDGQLVRLQYLMQNSTAPTTRPAN